MLWAVSDDPRVGPKTREMLDSPDHVRVVSAATIWEVEIKIAIGKLAVDEDLRIVLANSAVEPLQISMVPCANRWATSAAPWRSV